MSKILEMPLDLSPCSTGIPRCQPTFDLTKKQFMPHKNVQGVRELVRCKQDERLDKVLGKKMEINMFKGKPAITYCSGSSKESEGVERKRSISLPFSNWWRRSRSESVKNETDSFDYVFDLEESGQFNAGSSPWSNGNVPFSYPQQVTTATEYELIVRNEHEIYQQYYNHPVGPEYLTLSHSPQRDEELSRFRQTQNRRNQPESWFESCVGWKIAPATCQIA